jgi:NAD(P)-dependent dehydrogenase (short-subunit alcohol dehydrogenase family)
LNETTLTKVVNELNTEQKCRVVAQPVDIADRLAVKSFPKTTKERFGEVDGIANIAGAAGHKLGNEDIWETDDEEFDHIINVNVKGIFNVLEETLKPDFLEEPGSVVHISSMFSKRGYPKGSVFSASKHAAIWMIKTAAIEVVKRGVRVNAVIP